MSMRISTYNFSVANTCISSISAYNPASCLFYVCNTLPECIEDFFITKKYILWQRLKKKACKGCN